MKLNAAFYTGTNTLGIARNLLGKILFTKINGVTTGGIITETEAYLGITDRASHAYGGRFTERTSAMYLEGGVSYVYLCYGIHSLFNVVTNVAGVPHAILIRSIIPYAGEQEQCRRRGISEAVPQAFRGPGKVTQALGIDTSMTRLNLRGNTIWIEDSHKRIKKSAISATPRVGVEYAGPDALLPYRFLLG
ncbi:MAG TPA: DNA-3-methyladenine glycosylase [Bacteroidia bacterium]|nr:DNA-3-methyladenine glycosylase [Bacteroidia bacterium]